MIYAALVYSAFSNGTSQPVSSCERYRDLNLVYQCLLSFGSYDSHLAYLHEAGRMTHLRINSFAFGSYDARLKKGVNQQQNFIKIGLAVSEEFDNKHHDRKFSILDMWVISMFNDLRWLVNNIMQAASDIKIWVGNKWKQRDVRFWGQLQSSCSQQMHPLRIYCNKKP